MSITQLPAGREVGGLRIQHLFLRSQDVLLVDQKRPLTAPMICTVPSCRGTTHVYKTYHFRLDESGATTISYEIWEHIKRHPGQGGFQLANVVHEPPAQRVKVPLIRRNMGVLAIGMRKEAPGGGH